MEKAIVTGCPGSGKSVFARSLHEKTGLPLYPLDSLCWRPDRTMVPREIRLETVLKILRTDRWIIDGNYGSTMELRMAFCDTVFFLDYPTEICLQGVLARRGVKRPDLPWVEPADQTDTEFITFVQNYNMHNRPIILQRLQKLSGKEIYVFRTRSEADAFLERCIE